MDPVTASPLHPPISSLAVEILLSIFSLNGDMDVRPITDGRLLRNISSTSSLDTTINSSQVCRSWRNIILQASSLWGRVLQIDRMHELGEEWRKEIMRRTGDAPLHVQGSLWGARPSDARFLGNLFLSQWERIRRIDIGFGAASFFNDHDPNIFEAFLQAAPRLESFALALLGATSGAILLWGGQLFAGHAPSLREFCMVNIYFDIEAHRADAKALRGLCRLRLNSRDFRAIHILDAIKDMPFLEQLVLDEMEVPHAILLDDGLISLPNLTSLCFTDALGAAVPFAHAIKPADQCTLVWHSTSDRRTYNQEVIDIISRTLTSYSQSYFAVEPKLANFVRLVLTGDEFEFTAQKLATSKRSTYSPPTQASELLACSAFSINLTYRFPLGVTSSFLCCLSSASYSSITYLHFKVLSSSNLDDNRLGLTRLLKALTSVETIESWGNSLLVLEELAKDEALFPMLRRWVLPHALSSTGIVFSFLASRKRLGIPITVLELLSPRSFGDWGLLEEFDNLRVVWNSDGAERVYICGSGSPERLNFNRSY